MLNFLKSFFVEREYRAAVRSTIRELSKMSDAELRDIGIARGDIYSVAHGSTDYDRLRRQANEGLV